MSNRERIARALAACVLSSFLASCTKDAPATPPAPPPTTVQWSTNAQMFRDRMGQMVTIVCPPNGTPGNVWGSDVYSDDSSICTAALHSGRVTLAAGGVVSIQIAPGQPAYAATTRNGVSTRPWGTWSHSFTIVGGAMPGLALGAPAAPTPPSGSAGTAAREIAWSTRGLDLLQRGESAVVICPAGGRARSIWGTDTYSSDSSICTAAVHAGLFGFEGGTLKVSWAQGLGRYPSSRRNGVGSRSWGSWNASFTLEAAASSPYVCFEVTFADGKRNSECVRDAEKCIRDLAEMSSRGLPATFRGCEPTPTVYCYDPGNHPLCFVNMTDCVASQAIIPGGRCVERH